MNKPLNITHTGSAQLIEAKGDDLPTLIEIMPIGPIRLGDERGLVGQAVDPVSIIARSFEAATGGMLPIDFDHGIDGQSAAGSIAAGWISAMTVQGDRIMATVEWSDAGRAALRGRNYRFISPTFTTHPENNDVVRILRAGLTNNPALPELKQLASRQEDDPMPKWLTQLADKLGMKGETDETKILAAAETAIDIASHTNGIITAAGLTGDLDETSATAIETVLTASKANDGGEVKVDPSKYVPMDMYTATAAQVKNLQDIVGGQQTENLVTAAMDLGKLTPAQKDWADSYAAKDPEGFKTWTAAAPIIAPGGKIITQLEPTKEGELTEDERKVCAAMNLSEEAYLATKSGKPAPKATKEA